MEAAVLSTTKPAVIVRMDIAVKVKEIIGQKLGIEYHQLVDGTSFSDDLGIDSLDFYEIIMEIEKQFRIKIPDEKAERFKTVACLITYVEKTIG